MRREAGLDRHREVPKGALAGLRVEGRGLSVMGKRHRVRLVGRCWVRGTEGSESQRRLGPNFQYRG